MPEECLAACVMLDRAAIVVPVAAPPRFAWAPICASLITLYRVLASFGLFGDRRATCVVLVWSAALMHGCTAECSHISHAGLDVAPLGIGGLERRLQAHAPRSAGGEWRSISRLNPLSMLYCSGGRWT